LLILKAIRTYFFIILYYIKIIYLLKCIINLAEEETQTNAKTGDKEKPSTSDVSNKSNY